MRLTGTMIRILTEDHHFYMFKWRGVKCIEDESDPEDRSFYLLAFSVFRK